MAAGLTAWILFAVAPLVAHHAFKSAFDMDKPVHLEGKVTQLDYQNPHVFFHIDVKDSLGQTASWRLELAAPHELQGLGLTKGTISIGSDLVVDGFAARTGDRNMGVMEFKLKTNGQSFSMAEAWKKFDLPATGTPIIKFPSAPTPAK